MQVISVIAFVISVLVAIALFVLASRLSSIQDSIKSSVSQSVVDNMKEILSSFGSLKEEYGQISTKILTLNEISNDVKTLKSYLTNPKVRGRWGERLVEDIIKLVGLQENVNYVKQQATEEGRPDFTFFLPNGKSINLDAKFSLDNYMKYVESQNDMEREQFKDNFLKDIKNTIKEVAKRDYVNDKTVDFAIVFIASEAAYSFLIAEEPDIIDESLSKKIVLCSPTNLYAMLSVVRQASEYFTLEKTSKEIMELMQRFNKEWGNFTSKFDKLDEAIDNLRKTFNEITGTRKNKLDSILNDIEVKSKSVLEVPQISEDSSVPLNKENNGRYSNT
ncbi:DNA recombination protein RmuC [Caldisericum sp. AR60]|uniref:DNA recombination protein RmuC n=1 Tax=Caldisericum sp. AR60 TaxID=3397852 RepID=UPI0039FC0EE8